MTQSRPRLRRAVLLAATTWAACGAVLPPGSVDAGGALPCTPELVDLGDESAAVFTEVTTCSWALPAGASSVSMLIVGGGGSGGTSNENSVGGGGGGAVIHGINQSLNHRLVITVGAGGTITEACTPYATPDGGISSVYVDSDTPTTLIAFGGGHGAGCGENGQATAGGSGGGGHANWVSLGGEGTAGTFDGPVSGTIEFFGRAGGGGYSDFGVDAGGGGGGATEIGESGSINGGGDGGEGYTSDISGTAMVYGSGGGGSSTVGPGSGGTGAGNAAGVSLVTDLVSPYDGVDGTGGGGGGIANANPGRGGSGVVVFRWTDAALPGTGSALLLVGSIALAVLSAGGAAIASARRLGFRLLTP